MAGLIVLDASVVIAYLDGHDEHHAAAESLLAHLIDDDLGANSLTMAEVFVPPLGDERLQAVQEALSALEIHELSFPIDTAIRLAQLRVTTA